MRYEDTVCVMHKIGALSNKCPQMGKKKKKLLKKITKLEKKPKSAVLSMYLCIFL